MKIAIKLTLFMAAALCVASPIFAASFQNENNPGTPVATTPTSAVPSYGEAQSLMSALASRATKEADNFAEVRDEKGIWLIRVDKKSGNGKCAAVFQPKATLKDITATKPGPSFDRPLAPNFIFVRTMMSPEQARELGAANPSATDNGNLAVNLLVVTATTSLAPKDTVQGIVLDKDGALENERTHFVHEVRYLSVDSQAFLKRLDNNDTLSFKLDDQVFEMSAKEAADIVTKLDQCAAPLTPEEMHPQISRPQQGAAPGAPLTRD